MEEREEMIRLNRCHQSFYATFLFSNTSPYTVRDGEEPTLLQRGERTEKGERERGEEQNEGREEGKCHFVPPLSLLPPPLHQEWVL